MKVLEGVTKAESWVSDVLRHTSISYQAERDKNEGLTAFNNGTSKAMMDRHYRDVIEDQAQLDAYWALTPQSLAGEKIKLPLHDDRGRALFLSHQINRRNQEFARFLASGPMAEELVGGLPPVDLQWVDSCDGNEQSTQSGSRWSTGPQCRSTMPPPVASMTTKLTWFQPDFG